MAKHWETISILDDTMEVEVLEGFDLTEEYISLIDSYNTAYNGWLDEMGFNDWEDFERYHKIVLLGSGHFGEVYGLECGLAIKLLHNEYEEMPDGYILSKLTDAEMTPNVYAYSDEWDRGFMIVDRVRGFNVCDASKHTQAVLGFDLEKNLKSIDQFLEVCKREGVLPTDLHQANVMCDFEGNMKVVDVGCFDYQGFNEAEAKYCFENSKWSLLYQAYLLDHIINGSPMKNIPEGLPHRWYYKAGQDNSINNLNLTMESWLKQFSDYREVLKVGANQL